MALPNQGPQGLTTGPLVHCVPLWEPHPTAPGTMRIRRHDDGSIMFTPESVAQYEKLKAAGEIEAKGAPGPLVTDPNPVLAFYRKEYAYQHGTPRPAAGTFAAVREIPKEILQLIEKEQKLAKAESAKLAKVGSA